MEPTLIFATIFSMFNALIFGLVGKRLNERKISEPNAQLAWRLFSIWWFGLGASTLISGLLSLLGGLHITELPLFIAATYLNILFVCIALWGLLYYLLYLSTGNPKWIVPLSIFYVAYFTLLLSYITVSNPSQVQVGRWATTLVYAHPPTGPLVGILLILLVFPQIIAGLVYFIFFFRTRDTTQKYRILLVSWSIMIWFGSGFVAPFLGLTQFDWWQVANRFMTLGLALCTLTAYFPPTQIKRRFGIVSIEEQGT